MAASVSTCNNHTLVYSISYKNAFHSYCSHSYSFLPNLYNLGHRSTELTHKTDFLQKYAMKTTTC